ncbi:MAG: dTDP-glucose 4,6-dehydratase [Candidatus Aminicenantes bacterium]|nr:MAG: dTDP-glucose 4,6-dehydratase [Candidatus Aminicenantes bacterium]
MSSHRKLRSLMVTGGAGFIGSNFIHYLFKQKDFKGNVINVDKLTYAGNLENLEEIDSIYGENGQARYVFHQVDICDFKALEEIFVKHHIDTIVHFAAESHVDRSIYGPKDFIQTNIIGTFNLLEIARDHWQGQRGVLFHHISTDEVYGSLGETGYFFEDTPYGPRSPYSASKASSDHLVNAYFHTYGLPITLSNCSNNYGPYQFPEKLIPLMILNALEGKKLPVYGDGMNVRDWLYVEDHCSAVFSILQSGKVGETYNIGGENEQPNINVVNKICETLEELCPIKENSFTRDSDQKIENYKELVTFVTDRPGHDWRYAINCDKIKNELGWKPSVSFEEGLKKTVRWYLDHRQWINNVRSGEYKKWIEKNYGKR